MEEKKNNCPPRIYYQQPQANPETKLVFQVPYQPSPPLPPLPAMASLPAADEAISGKRSEFTPRCIVDPSYVRVLDTTLRDGEQAAGAAMTTTQKLAVARNLVLLGVDVIDAGFPASSPEVFSTVKTIAEEVGNRPASGACGHVPVISALARCVCRDIETAWAAVGTAYKPRICTFIATSEIHMKHKLRKSREEVVTTAREMVAYARSVGFLDISFGAEDSLRSDKDFLCRVFGEVIKAGATTLIIADTVGCSLPSEIASVVSYVRSHTPGIENAVISIHCHNDLGLAHANTLAGIESGAREMEVTINGIGERAGNAALEEVVMAIKCRRELMGGLYTGINTKYISATSQMVVDYTGLNLQPHKAIVGANAFSHESGIHQDGVLKYRGTYEFISREDIGLTQTNEPVIVLGKLSGRHALKSKLLKLGFDVDGAELDDVFKKFKELTAKKKHINDDDIEALVCSKTLQPRSCWILGGVQVIHGTIGFSTATVKLINLDGKEKIACSVGKGPIDASYKAIDSIVQAPVKLVEYTNSAMVHLNAISSTQVVIKEDHNHLSIYSATEKANGHANGHAPLVKANGHSLSFSGSGEEDDIVVSSVQAYLKALNRMLAMKHSSI